MVEEISPLRMYLMIGANVIIGFFLMVISPFLVVKSLYTPLERLITVYQVVQPNGVWDTPVKILTVTYLFWLILFVYAGATLIVMAKFIYDGKEWSYPTSLTLFAIPSIGGLTMVIPWIVLVFNGPVPGTESEVDTKYGMEGAGMSPAIWIMILGLIGYYIILFSMPGRKERKTDVQTIVSKLLVFTLLGVFAGYTWMNAQHGVRYFLSYGPRGRIDPSNSSPELFIGGFLMYTTVFFYLLAIFLIGYRKEAGIWVAVTTSLITTTVNFLVFIDRINMPSGSDWLKGAILSLVVLVVLLIPWVQKGVLETEEM